jgi:alpha-beta hydrolase superfamily lysophospholipase
MSGVDPLDRLGDIVLRSQVISVGGIELHYVAAGAADEPPVVLLHGFPKFWFGWRHQIPALAEAGFRDIAVDQRSYNRSAKPAGPAAYDLDLLAGDVLGLAAHLARYSIAGSGEAPREPRRQAQWFLGSAASSSSRRCPCGTSGG